MNSEFFNMNAENEVVIVGIGGSLRKGSFSRKVLEKAADLMPDGSSLRIADISKIPIFNSDYVKEPDKSVIEFKKLVLESDGFLIVTVLKTLCIVVHNIVRSVYHLGPSCSSSLR